MQKFVVFDPIEIDRFDRHILGMDREHLGIVADKRGIDDRKMQHSRGKCLEGGGILQKAKACLSMRLTEAGT